MNMNCDIYRNPGEPWGFRLQGGSDYRSQLGIKKVTPGGPAARSLRANDEILAINNTPTKDMSHRDAEAMIKNSGDSISLTIKRGDNPLANYRPEGPIKFNVQRAQQAQQAMGIQATSPSVYPGYSPAINGYNPAMNGYTATSPQQPQQPAFPWNASVAMQGQPVRNVDFESYY